MSHDFVQKRVKVTDPGVAGSGHINLNSAAIVMRLAPAVPVYVTHWGFISDSAFTSSGSFQLGLATEAVVDSGTLVAVDTLTVGTGIVIAAGQGFARNVNIPKAQTTGGDGSLDNSATGEVGCNPGSALVLSVLTAAGNTATGLVFIEYVEKGFIDKVGADVTGTPAQTTLFTMKAS